MCYRFNIKDRIIDLACPIDYQLYIERLQTLKNESFPLVQIISLEQDSYLSNEMIEQDEEWQESLSKGYFKINSEIQEIQQLNEQLQHMSISEIHQIDYHKCYFCDDNLEYKKYFRCIICNDFQICEECNTHKREQEHPNNHIFIQCNHVIEWNKLKQDSYIKLMKQKVDLLKYFKIHSVNIHEQITCDGCENSPILGYRYQCCECSDFDLCKICIKEFKHDETHNFIQLTTNIEFLQLQ
ncbi:unnamed protein product [Paramecium primaurelia]|uniref:ZZ-type domain-containing protein n=1 Tax=Paramecium primaurelia TaxID=5886 RepID=A0A8S1K6G8_PARPR|nr:unnamed protein product [Paramecium primaurelia]